MNSRRPTPYPELNQVLDALVSQARAILGDVFIGAYLQGSFAVGDYDEHSDVDFLIVVERPLADTEAAALQDMHAEIFRLASPWAQHLEGSYFPRDVLRRYIPGSGPLLYVDNGSQELVLSQHDNTLVVRWMTREHGIALAGPDPKRLIDPVSPADLRREVRATMHEWGEELLADPARMDNRWYQPFVVLSYCRMLHTLETGAVMSKPAGARWALRTLDRRWRGLIQRAWEERPHPSRKVQQKADPEDLASTVAFIHYALALASQAD